MQQVQDRLEFQIETPSDEELAKRFADHKRKIEATFGVPQKLQGNVAKKGHKTRNRKSKQQKKQERINRDKVEYFVDEAHLMGEGHRD